VLCFATPDLNGDQHVQQRKTKEGMKLLEFGRATERGSVSGCGWAHRRALTLNNYTYCTETSNQIKYQFTDVHTISFFRSLHILQCHLQHPSSHQPLPTKTHPPLHHKPHSPSKTPPHPLSPKPPSSDSPPTPYLHPCLGRKEALELTNRLS